MMAKPIGLTVGSGMGGAEGCAATGGMSSLRGRRF